MIKLDLNGESFNSAAFCKDMKTVFSLCVKDLKVTGC